MRIALAEILFLRHVRSFSSNARNHVKAWVGEKWSTFRLEFFSVSIVSCFSCSNQSNIGCQLLLPSLFFLANSVSDATPFVASAMLTRPNRTPLRHVQEIVKKFRVTRLYKGHRELSLAVWLTIARLFFGRFYCTSFRILGGEKISKKWRLFCFCFWNVINQN